MELICWSIPFNEVIEWDIYCLLPYGVELRFHMTTSDSHFLSYNRLHREQEEEYANSGTKSTQLACPRSDRLKQPRRSPVTESAPH